MSSQQGQCQSEDWPSPRWPAGLQDTQSAKLSFLNKVQQCFAVRKGLEGMLDLARDVFCRATEQVHELMATYREQHKLDCLKVGTCWWPWLPVFSAQSSSMSSCNGDSSCQQHGLDGLMVGSMFAFGMAASWKPATCAGLLRLNLRR